MFDWLLDGSMKIISIHKTTARLWKLIFGLLIVIKMENNVKVYGIGNKITSEFQIESTIIWMSVEIAGMARNNSAIAMEEITEHTAPWLICN